MKRIAFALLAVAFAFNAEAQTQRKFLPPPPPPPEVIPSPPEATATLQTSMGDLVFRLESKKAPRTVDNFITYARAGYYDNMRIYRVAPGFLIQTGDTTAEGGIKSPLKRPIKLETDNGLRHARGTVSLAHADSGPNTGANTFYVDLGPNASLNPKPGAAPNTTGYAVFGRVIKGLEVADAIAAVKRKPKSAGGAFPGEEPVTPVILKKVIITEVK